METRQFCSVTDISLRIISEQIKYFEARLFDHFVRNDCPVAGFRIALETEQASRRILNEIDQFPQRFLRWGCLDMRAVN